MQKVPMLIFGNTSEYQPTASSQHPTVGNNFYSFCDCNMATDKAATSWLGLFHHRIFDAR